MKENEGIMRYKSMNNLFNVIRALCHFREQMSAMSITDGNQENSDSGSSLVSEYPPVYKGTRKFPRVKAREIPSLLA